MENTKPVINIGILAISWLDTIKSKVCFAPAKIITGKDNKKENLLANLILNPNNKLAVKVIPDLETPGIMATLCAIPINNDLLVDNSLIPKDLFAC